MKQTVRLLFCQYITINLASRNKRIYKLTGKKNHFFTFSIMRVNKISVGQFQVLFIH